MRAGRGRPGLAAAARVARWIGGWPARRVGLAAVAGALLVGAALLGRVAPLQAQEGEAPEATGASGVSIRMDDLVDLITYSIVHRFEVQVSQLDAAATYDVVVSSSNAPALGIGGCGTAAQTATVTGATAQNLSFIVYACGVGAGTVTAEVRRAGAATAEVAVSQGVTVEPIPAWVPDAERPVRGSRGAVAQVGTPSFVRNPRFEQVMPTSVVAKWDTPTGNGGAELSGYGLLFWHEDDDHPDYRDDVLVKGLIPREHTYTGLQHDATYKFRIHACNETPACGWWTNPPLEVTTERAPTPQRPHTITFAQISSDSARVRWSAAANTGGVPLTGFDLRYWPYDPDNPDEESGAIDHPADDGNDRGETLRGLAAGTEYALKLRACNGPKDSHCSRWSDDHRFTTTAGIRPRPQNLDVVPLAQRRVEVRWSRVEGASGYGVEVTHDLTSSEPAWRTARNLEDRTAIIIDEDDENLDKPRKIVIHLDDIYLTEATTGLAQHEAHKLRIRARFDSGNPTYSDTIIIIDTPITIANGKSPRGGAGEGTVALQWKPIREVLGTDYGFGEVQLRYRRYQNDHTAADWRPEEESFDHSKTTTRVTGERDTIDRLDTGRLYAIQYWYIPPAASATQHRVYAARDVYAWPSHKAPANGSRVATFPLTTKLQSQRFLYRVCGDTFGPPGDTRRGQWEELIRVAFEQWATATKGLVSFGRILLPCATDYESGYTYNRITDEIKRILALGRDRTDDEIAGDVVEFVDSLRVVGVESLDGTSIIDRLFDKNIQQSEVLMYDDMSLGRLVRVGAFPDIATDIGYWKECWYRKDDSTGRYEYKPANICTYPYRATSDIIVRRGAYDAGPGSDHGVSVDDKLELPAANAQFNACRNSSDDGLSAFQAMVHEVGHVIGIAGGSNGTHYSKQHPTIADSAVNYDNMVIPDNSKSGFKSDFTEPDCSPHPFDVMAVFALYQTRFTTS